MIAFQARISSTSPPNTDSHGGNTSPFQEISQSLADPSIASDSVPWSFRLFLLNSLDLSLRQHATIHTHLMFRSRILSFAPPAYHAPTVTAPIERDMAIRVFADVRLKCGIACHGDHYIIAWKVGPESSVLIADGAVALEKRGGFGRQLNADATAVTNGGESFVFAAGDGVVAGLVGCHVEYQREVGVVRSERLYLAEKRYD
jgi:hypothetical protein